MNSLIFSTNYSSCACSKWALFWGRRGPRSPGRWGLRYSLPWLNWEKLQGEGWRWTACSSYSVFCGRKGWFWLLSSGCLHGRQPKLVDEVPNGCFPVLRCRVWGRCTSAVWRLCCTSCPLFFFCPLLINCKNSLIVINNIRTIYTVLTQLLFFSTSTPDFLNLP